MGENSLVGSGGGLALLEHVKVVLARRRVVRRGVEARDKVYGRENLPSVEVPSGARTPDQRGGYRKVGRQDAPLA